jgi:hypothetical protein
MRRVFYICVKPIFKESYPIGVRRIKERKKERKKVAGAMRFLPRELPCTSFGCKKRALKLIK